LKPLQQRRLRRLVLLYKQINYKSKHRSLSLLLMYPRRPRIIEPYFCSISKFGRAHDFMLSFRVSPA
jgi:hypothetical protein